MTTRGVIFDMDGVLVDSEPLTSRAALMLFRELGYPQVREDEFAAFVGGGEDAYIAGTAERYGISLDVAEAKARMYAIYIDELVHQLDPFPGAVELVRRCRDDGLRTAIGSATDRVRLDANIGRLGLPADAWDAVVSASDVERKKPAPDIFVLAAERMRLKPVDCVVIEDSLNGVLAAVAAGMRAVAVTTSFAEPELVDAGADVVRPTIADVTRADLG